jgi:hypothetical protein
MERENTMDYVFELLTKDEENYIWNYIYKELSFNPSINKSIVPFKIDKIYNIYDFSSVKDDYIDKMEGLISNVLLKCIERDEFIYALDWQHSGFKCTPIKRFPLDNERILWVEDSKYNGGGYNAYFPSFYPDGDYYFFIVNTLEWGYLGHPWQEKIWIFGEKLISEIEKIKKEINFVKFEG